MTVTADPLEQLLTDPPSDGDLLHWAFSPYKVALCGIELDWERVGEAETQGLEPCRRCEHLGRLYVDHGIWEGPGPRPPG